MEVETRSRSLLLHRVLSHGVSGRLLPRPSVRLFSPGAVPREREMPAMGNSLRAAALLAFVVLSVLVSLLIGSLQQFGAQIARFPNATAAGDDEEFASLRRALIYQLNERRKEIIPLLSPPPPGEAPRSSSQHHQPPTSNLDSTLWSEIAEGLRKARLDEVGCESLVDVQALQILGSGYTKLVVKVNLAGGQPAALKLVNEQGIDMEKCLEDFKDPRGCRELVAYKLKKEMVLLQRLQHPNVIKVKLYLSPLLFILRDMRLCVQFLLSYHKYVKES